MEYIRLKRLTEFNTSFNVQEHQAYFVTKFRKFCITEEPEDNRRSKLPSGGARAWSTDFDARNIGDGDRTSESPSPSMAVLIARPVGLVTKRRSFSGCRFGDGNADLQRCSRLAHEPGESSALGPRSQ